MSVLHRLSSRETRGSIWDPAARVVEWTGGCAGSAVLARGNVLARRRGRGRRPGLDRYLAWLAERTRGRARGHA